MNSTSRFLAIPLFAMLASTAHAAGPAKTPLRYVIMGEDTPAVPNASRFQEVLAIALARQMGRPLRMLSLPRKRMANALDTGDGDVLCGYQPGWLSGDIDWSRPFIPITLVLVSSPHVPPPVKIDALRGKRIGTVLGFQYPEMEAQLGAEFVRDDAASNLQSLRKWQAGRFDYFIAARTMIDNQAAKGALPSGYHLLVIQELQSMCAVARKGKVGVNELNAAIGAIEKSGELARLLRLR